MTETAPRKVDLVDRRRVYDGYFKVDCCRLRHELFEGGMSGALQREVVARDGEVAAVLPLDPAAGAVVLVEQFRPGPWAAGANPWTLECVAGVMERGESPEQLVHREAREEAGLEILQLELMHRFLSTPGMSSELVHLFCGRVKISGQDNAIHGVKNEGENIRTVICGIGEALSLLKRGKIANGKTIIALQWLALYHREIIRKWRQ